MLRELYAEIEQTFGLRLPELEYGPGLAVPYFDGDDFYRHTVPGQRPCASTARSQQLGPSDR